MDAMCSNKRSKSNRERRISKLPDAILQRILSFLPTKDAVKTSVLSRRWEYLWTSTPNLEFIEYGNSDNFMPFVDRAISLHISDVIFFSLRCTVDGDEPCVKRLIAAVVRRNVEELRLHIGITALIEPLELPRCLFVSASLTRLDLSICCTLKFPSSICLLSLKHLRFQYIIFTDEVSTMQFFSGCPALETLRFDECNWTHLCSVGLCAPKLWKLEITEYMNCWSESDFDSCEIMIIAPCLHYLYYDGEFLNAYCIYDSPSLNEAEIHLREVGIGWPRIDLYRFYKLLKGISNVKQLLLSSDTGGEELNLASDLLPYMPCFNNLSTLSFSGTIIKLDCKALIQMLQCSPCLEKLCFKEGEEISSDCENHELLFNPVPPCFLSHLKRIEIYQNYADKELDREIVEILLSRAVVLDKLIVSYSECMEKKKKLEKVLKKFLSLPRASEVLEINFTP